MPSTQHGSARGCSALLPLVALAALLLGSACQSSTATPTRDGSSRARAIQLRAQTLGAGIAAQHAWLDKYLPGWRFVESGIPAAGEGVITFAHRTEADKTGIFSVYTVQLPDGSVRDVFFDQSAYFGQ